MTKPVSERIAIVAPSIESVAIMRRDLIEWLAERGHRVLCLTPPGAGTYVRILRAIGAQHRAIEASHPSLRMIADWQMVVALVAQFKDWQPNIVLGSGPRTLTLTALAARRAGVRRVVSLVNGLPDGSIEGIGRRRFGDAIRASDAVVFHNRDDQQTLARLDLLPGKIETLIVPGGGINLKSFRHEPMPPHDGPLSFLMLGRLERRRGVLEYKAAAEKLKARWPSTNFRFAGRASDAPDAVSVAALTEGGAIEYLGVLEDVRPALAACHVFVYPTHGEGMPHAALEALATGRPIVTTRTPGCVELVDEMVSGCCVEPSDAGALAAALESYLKHPEQLTAASRAARLKAERRFDARDVNTAFARVLGVA